MPNLTNETVLTGSYNKYKNSNPQLLDNGWLVVAVFSSTNSRLQFRVKKTPSSAWEDLAYITSSTLTGYAIARKGTRIYFVAHASNSNAIFYATFDAVTIATTTAITPATIEFSSISGQFGGIDLAINAAGTELHLAFTAQTIAYPTMNLRYMLGAIDETGEVRWGYVEQVTTLTSTTGQVREPSIAVVNGTAGIVTRDLGFTISGSGVTYDINQNQIRMYMRDKSLQQSVQLGDGWTYSEIYSIASRAQYLPNAIYVPKAVNGIAYGRIWATWNGGDGVSANSNIRTAFSDDLGVTWSTPVKQTTENSLGQSSAMLTADNAGKVFLVWEALDNSSGSTYTVTKERVFSSNAWATATSYAGNDYFTPTVLYDINFRLTMTKPPLIRSASGNGISFSGNYPAPAAVAPYSADLGTKSDKALFTYTVTPEAGATVTKIDEIITGIGIQTFNSPASLNRTFTVSQAHWDAMKFYNAQKVRVVVTDSNGGVSDQTYTIRKTLLSDAPLLDATKAVQDTKDATRAKVDALATKVGLATGSTLDQINTRIGSGAFRKVASGTVMSSSTLKAFNLVDGTQNNMNILQVSGLGFTPSVVVLSKGVNANFDFTGYYMMDPNVSGRRLYRHAYYNTEASSASGTSKVFEIVESFKNGFALPVSQGNILYSYIAYE
ncbi:hypothetical protein BLD48_05695 [Exiguobacterium sp. KRL4]|uniref:hypothetical protein n=1 Tax=Exiguobacterium sp. KRL4 TaxID=1914536 RepID=UPI0008F86445|nr:hypothetical protein [Exiguobacterium sp. KRL4]OIN67383.1 hypothetical protein BLD48_05695 [Exiguobacterium sp. KRL4]